MCVANAAGQFMEGICWFEKTGIEKNRVHSWEATRHNIYKKAVNVTKMCEERRKGLLCGWGKS